MLIYYNQLALDELGIRLSLKCRPDYRLEIQISALTVKFKGCVVVHSICRIDDWLKKYIFEL